MPRYYWRLKRPWPTITGYQKNDLEASNDISYYYGYFDDLTHWELANGKVQNYFYCDKIGIPREIANKDGNLVWGLLWLGQTEERNQRNGCRCIIGKRYMYRKMPGRKKRKKCLEATVENIKMVTAKTSYLTLQKGVSIPAVARYNQTL